MWVLFGWHWPHNLLTTGLFDQLEVTEVTKLRRDVASRAASCACLVYSMCFLHRSTWKQVLEALSSVCMPVCFQCVIRLVVDCGGVCVCWCVALKGGCVLEFGWGWWAGTISFAQPISAWLTKAVVVEQLASEGGGGLPRVSAELGGSKIGGGLKLQPLVLMSKQDICSIQEASVSHWGGNKKKIIQYSTFIPLLWPSPRAAGLGSHISHSLFLRSLVFFQAQNIMLLEYDLLLVIPLL